MQSYNKRLRDRRRPHEPLTGGALSLVASGFCISKVRPEVVKSGGLRSQSLEGEAVAVYCEALAMQNLEPSGFATEKKDGVKQIRS